MVRQSQFERRIAVELLHARHEKDVIRENFIAKERDIEEKRAKEFYDALEKERVRLLLITIIAYKLQDLKLIAYKLQDLKLI